MLYVLSSLFPMHRSILFAFATLTLPALALAASFPDVQSNVLYYEQINTLSDMGIIKGNPDGTFSPNATVNRAELLTLLYRAKGKTPSTPTSACFKDVQVDAWFSAIVCDSAKNGYVGGYPDGNFRPANAVNRVEALKMIHTVLGLSVNASASIEPLKAFSDVSLTAWYAPYMASAFDYKVLPVVGQKSTFFFPEAALTRGEAAAYIFNGLGLKVKSASTSSSSVSVQSSTQSSVTSRSSTSRSSTSSQVSAVDPVLLQVDFPFNDDGMFSKKVSKIYTFSLTKKTTNLISISVGTDETVQCRLYKLDKDTSFALEYYVGQVIGNTCWMRTTLSSGNYQLEVLPSVHNGNFKLTTKIVTGDGNDGFSEASNLLKGSPKTGYLEAEDFGEFYTFTLTAPKTLTVSVSNDAETDCLVFPMANVDLFGFSGPVCDAAYEYPVGTYVIGVTRRAERDKKISFSVSYQ